MLAELGVSAEPEPERAYTAEEERMLAGFEEVQRFAAEHGRAPRHGADRDIFERLYAVRLDRMRSLPACRALLGPLDAGGLLGPDAAGGGAADGLSDEQALDELGVGGADDVSTMRHVRLAAERRSPEEVAKRKPCADFERAFAGAFAAVQAELDAGERRTARFRKDGRDEEGIAVGDWFVLDGHKACVASAGSVFKAEHGENDRRLRVVFDNATESDLLMRSLRRALNKDDASRRILPRDDDAGPLFVKERGPGGAVLSGEAADGDVASGRVYVVRSLSSDPFVAEHREVLHKIGVTGGDVKKRLANAAKDPTFLLAGVEQVAGWELANLHRHKLEHLLHGFFAEARLDVQLQDRFGSAVEPREWFLVPLPLIEEAVERLIAGTLGEVRYDPQRAAIQPR
ncbi:GIY-YIG nuclease family protein [Phycisphaera mikurensis]|uniref:Bacteriophage T5 Orf172 DNA-binding domain-containing protein n=1 Tax=Phycisphaera mikurensis (strain NBRC 102666 / KCTC 22515 / FYK2301M01) TaxID=1142394 RepID=I0IAZ7_PHYMF|nr:hypothetical protein PSMK_02760 [Phycisphaera mikurensis NBRC 102666]